MNPPVRPPFRVLACAALLALPACALPQSVPSSSPAPLPPPATAPAPAATPQRAPAAAAPLALPPSAVPVASKDIALLLPLSGALASAGAAIRDGFMTAYLRAGGKTPVRVYDSASGATGAYQQALHDGAGIVVGPLRKEQVATLAAQAQLPAPLLALNYLDSGTRVPADFYQFGLAPEDEARAAAERAVADGGRRAVALVPDSEWGRRVLAAFSQRLTELGGEVLQSGRFSSGQNDFSKPIQALLKLDASTARHRALTQALGIKTEFEPRRRTDVDFIFFAARPSDARLIWPQLRFFRAADLPAYATSLVYSGTPQPELNGVRFCDMPWILQDNGDIAAQRIEVGELASERAQPRLFALGMDAWRLASLIQAGQLAPNTVYPAASGGLKLGAGGVIGRELSCARFADGTPRLIDLSLPAAAPFQP